MSLRLFANGAIVALAASTAAASSIYVLPIASAKVKDRLYSTTVALRNDGSRDATCEAVYAIPNDPKGGTLRATYNVPAGGTPQVEEDVLAEAGAIGTLRVVCSTDVALAARIQSSPDGGKAFDEGRTFVGLREDAATHGAATITLHARRDVVVEEVAGKAVTIEAVVKDAGGREFGRKTYDLPAFAQQIVNLSKAHLVMEVATVDVRITSGEGAIVADDETRDPALLIMAVRKRPETRAALAKQTAQTAPATSQQVSGVSPIRMLGVAAFKAAPFQDPMTGLIFMRGRWYDPQTGTFLSPDPLGYGDSANLYSYCGGDPVNCSDPTGDKIQFKGNNPRGEFELFKRSLHNPAAAALLDLDVVHGNIVVFKKGATKAQFIKAALPQWPYFEDNERDLGIPVSTDKRSIEEKYASLITSPRLVEITAQPGAAALEKPDAFLRFFGVKSIPHKAAAEGGGVTLFASESVTGNTSIAIDPAYVKLSGPTIASWYGLDAYDTELVLTHELGHALADIEGVSPCRQTWSIYLENQLRSRMGHYGNLRYSEYPVNKDPNTMRCGHEEPDPKTKKP